MDTANLQTATLGGGCFWCLEAVFQQLRGVQSVTSGYAGGSVDNPSYKQVCTGTTGHAEVVQVVFDPAVLSFADLLEVFFHVHDPTTLNRQGNDVGTQYRSAIFCHDDEQRHLAEEAIRTRDAAGLFDGPIITEVTMLDRFYPAEDSHHDYFRQNPQQGYCQFVIGPKVEKVRRTFRDRLAN